MRLRMRGNREIEKKYVQGVVVVVNRGNGKRWLAGVQVHGTGL